MTRLPLVAMTPTNQMKENMKRAQVRDSVHREKFFFRKSLVPDDDEDDDNEGAEPQRSHDNEYTEMTIDTIINGKVCNYTAFLSACLYSILGMVSG